MEQNLCGMTKKEILEMLSSIKKICDGNTCDSCPFTNGNRCCYIADNYPNGWNLHSGNSIWRAFG